MTVGKVKTCGQCVRAKPYAVPREVLEKWIRDQRGQFNLPKVKKLLAVQNGMDYLVRRTCAKPKIRHTFASTLCASPAEFSGKRQSLRRVAQVL